MPVNQSHLSTWSPRGIPEAINPVNNLFNDTRRGGERGKYNAGENQLSTSYSYALVSSDANWKL